MKKIMVISISLLLAASCGGGMYTKEANDGASPDTGNLYITPWGNATVTKDAFIFASDYPSDIVIPDIDGMRGTAFVVSLYSPAGVIAIDLDSNPLRVSSRFKGLISPAGSGYPNALAVAGKNRAFLLTSSHLIDFDPESGGIHKIVNLTGKYRLPRPLPISGRFDINGDGREDSSTSVIDMSYPGGIGITGDRIFVTLSNYINPVLPAVAAPGLVRVFRMTDSPPYISEAASPIVTTDFNPTGVTPLKDGTLLVTNSGVSDIWSGAAHPITNSSIDIIDAVGASIAANISIGKASLAFREMAVTSDESAAFIGSASYGEVYEIDLQTKTAVRMRANPIAITGAGEGGDYLSSVVLSFDDWYLFAASFDRSAIYPVDISTAEPDVLPAAFPTPFVLGFPKGVTSDNPTGTNTGIGDIAIRPGTPGVDYTSPDLFALTGNPGTLVTINTHGNGIGEIAQIKGIRFSTEDFEIENGGGAFRLNLILEFYDGSVLEDVADTFVNPYSKYPTRVNWSSSNPGVATVSGGSVTPVSAGTAVISARVGFLEARANLTVVEIEEAISDDGDGGGESGEGTEQGGPDEEDDAAESGEGGSGPNPPVYGIPYPHIDVDIRIVINDWRNDIRQLISDRYRWFEDETEGDESGEDSPQILTEAPAGTDPFADRVTRFTPGDGAGFGSGNMPSVVLGPPRGAGEGAGSMHVVSLGRRGEIVLEMADFIIADGDGPDFIVFENPFSGWVEPGTVSVSIDGRDFREFPCFLHDRPRFTGCAGVNPVFANPDNGIDPTDPDEAGGDAFDLADVGLDRARFVKIVDGLGLGLGGNSAGFDLDAVSVVNGVLP